MNSSDNYYENIRQMLEIKKTNISSKDLEKFYLHGEKALENLEEAIIEMKKWGDGELPPSIPPRDQLPDMYMRYGRWDDAERVIRECYRVGVLKEEELEEHVRWINNCQAVSLEVLAHIDEFPEVQQKDMYKRLYKLDKNCLKWVLRFYYKISKTKYKNTNKLYLKGEEPKELFVESESLETIPGRSALIANIDFPDWYIKISFGKSSSSNYQRALFLARQAPIYLEDQYEGEIVHSAVYGKSSLEYLAFIQIYELIHNWKSTFVICNGHVLDRKIIGQLNYCYGDKCRTGQIDFCFGASMFTDNPFGCHRLQISRYNNPWWSFYRKTQSGYILDKGEIFKRTDIVAEVYKYCPDFDLAAIKQVINELPLMVDDKGYSKLMDENQNYGDQLVRKTEGEEFVITYTAPKSKAKAYYENRNKDPDEKSIVGRLFDFLKRG
ncbi:MAG: hypothetical protein GX947_00885 [Tissierellia bacterium]|nr:hypothetical protein [Tissierellia bacterium]